jgi:DNA polymerase-1
VDPLIEKIVNGNRIHPSLSLDTSTGRLTCKKPNLHNPPNASDTLGLRAAFTAAPGNSLIVADYSQLELRILAHVTDCKSMISSLNAGGDYHSWTTYDMFPEVRNAVDSGECHVVSAKSNGVVLVKSKFPSHRSKAKAINFSIAYGKCARSIAEEMDIELSEAEGLLERWYASKPEVAQWKQDTIFNARVSKKVRSILGRTRDIPHINKPAWKGRSERAAVNHCIQGSAADIAICAMLRIGNSPCLERMGFRLLMQIHDEFIIEGPSEFAEEAKAVLCDLMRNPFAEINPAYRFKVELEVDAGIGKNWLEAKP